MEQVFRIEIPVEAVDKTDTASINSLETLLQKLFSTMQKNKSAANDVFESMEKGAAEAGDAYKDTAQAAQQAGQKSGSAFNQAATSTDRFTQRVQKSEKTLRSMFREKLSLTLAAIDRASPILKGVASTVKGLVGKAWKITVRMADFVTAPIRKLYRLVSNPITLALSVAGIGLGAGDIVNTFNEFTTGMSAVQSLSGATGTELKQLTQLAKDLGATTSFSASQASEGMQYLAMAGWETSEIIAAMPGLLNLAAAGATELGTAADIVSDVMTAMSMKASEASRAADVFAKTATSSNTTIEGLGNTMKYAAPIAATFGASLEDISAAAGLMANAGIKGEMAGTALRSSLLRMSKPTSEMTSAMSKLSISFADSSGKMKSMKDIVRMLDTAFSGLTESERLSYAQQLFGTEAASAWLGIISQGADAYDAMSESLYNCSGAAKQMANTRLDNLAGDMTLLNSALESTKIELMEKFGPYLRQGVQWLTSKIPTAQRKLESMIDSGIAKAKKLYNYVSGVFNGTAFKNADGFAEKFFVAWDKIITEPFQSWWNQGGQDTILNTISSLGKNIGKLLNGIITGIFAALKGERIDFEGLNITGIAKAGAEAATSFVSSFKSSFKLGDLLGDMPGLMKAGLFGFGALKFGQGAFGIYKTVSGLKAIFSGVSAAATVAAPAVGSVGTSAATAAVGIGKSVSILGGLKSALAAVPVWGWVAAAAVSAVAVGVKLYNDEKKRQREELLNLGNTMREHAENYRREAETINDITESVQTLRIIEINAHVTGLGPEEIQDVQTKIAMLSSREKQLEYLISLGGTDEEMDAWQAELDGIRESQAQAAAELAKLKEGYQDVIDLVNELNGLEDPSVTITATLKKLGITDKEDIQLIEDLAAHIGTSVGLLSQTLILLGADEVTDDDIEKITSLSENIETKLGALRQALSVLGADEVTDDDIKRISSLSDNINSGMGALVQTLSLLGINNASPENIEKIKQYATTIQDKKAELKQLMTLLENGDITEDGIKRISQLKDEIKTDSGALLQLLSVLGASNISADDLQLIEDLGAKITTDEGNLKQVLELLGASQVTNEDINKITALSDNLSEGDMELRQTLELLGIENVTDDNLALIKSYGNTILNDSKTLTQTLELNGYDKIEDMKDVLSFAKELLATGDEVTLDVKTALKGYGLTVLGIASLQSMLKDSSNWTAAVIAYLDKETSLTPEQITEYVNTLKANSQRKIEITTQLDGAALTHREIATLNTELESIKARKLELDIAVNGETATKEQIDEYNKLAERQGVIELMLSGVELTAQELAALTEEYEDLKNIDSTIYVKMSESGLNASQIEKVANDIKKIGDVDAIIQVAVTHTEQGAEDAAAAAKQTAYEEIASQLNKYYGTSLTAEQLASGWYDDLIKGHNSDWSRDQQEAKWHAMKYDSEYIKDARSIPSLQSEIASAESQISKLEADANQARKALSYAAEFTTAVDKWSGLYSKAQNTYDENDFYEWVDNEYLPAIYDAYKNLILSKPGNEKMEEWAVEAGFEMLDKSPSNLKQITSSGDYYPSTVGIEADYLENTLAKIRQLKADIADFKNGLIDAYNVQKQIATSEHFIGSAYFENTIEEIAANYAQLNEEERAMFADAVKALNELNKETDYIGITQKAQASDIVDLAAKSELMNGIRAQVDAIEQKYGQIGEEELLNLDSTEEGKQLLEELNTTLEALGKDKVDSLKNIGTALEAIRTVDMSTFSVEQAQAAIQALAGSSDAAKTSVDSLRESYASLAGLLERLPQGTVSIEIIKPTSIVPKRNASGGIYDGAFLSWVAEDGPEAIIPLGEKRHDRGVDLWLQAGRMLGVTEFADGGILAPYAASLEKLPNDIWDNGGNGSPTRPSGSTGGGGYAISVDVTANPVYNIEGGADPESILEVLRAKQKEIAEMVGEAIADELNDIVSNMV